MFSAYRPLALETRPLYEAHIAPLPQALPSTLFFQGLYAWNLCAGHRWRLAGEHLCIVVQDTRARAFLALPPLGPMQPAGYAAAVAAVYADFAAEGLPCVFAEVPAFLLPLFRGLPGTSAEVSEDRAATDYLYTLEDFKHSYEKPSARTALNHLRRHHAPQYQALGPAHREAVLDITRQHYCRVHTCPECVYGCEMWVVGRLMEAFEALALRGVLVYAGGEPVAFEIACRQKDTLFCIAKKVRRGLRGINELVNLAAIELCGEGCRRVNYSDDMGLSGLRSYKTRLGAHTLEPRYRVALHRA